MKSDLLAKYYALSAATYDSVNEIEERLDDVADLEDEVAELLAGHKVLELACGTGCWTQVIADVAESVHAIDFSPEMLAEAAKLELDPAQVQFSLADAYDLPDSIVKPGQYTAVFAAGWWSHVKREDQERFLKHLRAKVGSDVLLVLIDSSYVDGATLVFARTDLEGNTFQIRTAPNGERIEVLKNYPTDSTLRKKLATAARNVRVDRLEYFYLLTCRLK